MDDEDADELMFKLIPEKIVDTISQEKLPVVIEDMSPESSPLFKLKQVTEDCDLLAHEDLGDY